MDDLCDGQHMPGDVAQLAAEHCGGPHDAADVSPFGGVF